MFEVINSLMKLTQRRNNITYCKVYSSLRQQIKTTHLMQCGALYCEVNREHEKVTALTDCLLRKINMRFYALEG